MYPVLSVPYEYGSAHFVPAAAVLLRLRALSGFIVFRVSLALLLSQFLTFAARL